MSRLSRGCLLLCLGGLPFVVTVPARKGAGYAALNPCASAAHIRNALLARASVDAKLASQVQNGRHLNLAGFATELACP